MSACIIPTTPDFQDPLAGPNYPPYIESATPDFGSTVTPPQLRFSVTVTDPNVGDDLFVLWLADYPGVNRRTVPGDRASVSHSTTGAPLHESLSAPVDCTVDNLVSDTNGTHRIEVIIADRPFVDPVSPDTHLDLVAKPGFAVRASWVLEQLFCPSGPTP
jgi:hypothetical protein